MAKELTDLERLTSNVFNSLNGNEVTISGTGLEGFPVESEYNATVVILAVDIVLNREGVPRSDANVMKKVKELALAR